MKQYLCATAASAFVVLTCSAALAKDRTPASPWSKLFPLPADRVTSAKPAPTFLAQAPAVVGSEAAPCSRIVSKPVDPAFDREMRHAAPTRPRPSSRSMPTRACRPSN
ncbi:MAG: hypothetical protein JSU08_07980 [Acidobacteria bacterium]|nr:hypothetical protein [Acidobacteriota bacterium]